MYMYWGITGVSGKPGYIRSVLYCIVCFIDCTGMVQNHSEYKKSYRETKYYINSQKAEHNQKKSKQNDI